MDLDADELDFWLDRALEVKEREDQRHGRR